MDGKKQRNVDRDDDSKEHTPFWIRGKVEMKTTTQSLWYMECDTCGWMSFAQLNEMYLCNYCKYMHARAIPRARCSVNIGDYTGNITASLFDDVAEKFFRLPAEEIMKDSIMPDHVIGAHKSNYMDEDNFIYMKVGNPDPKTNQPKFDVRYILDDNRELEEVSPIVSPYDAKNKASFNCTYFYKRSQKFPPIPRRNLVFETEIVEQPKTKKKMISSDIPKDERNVVHQPDNIITAAK